MPRDSAHQGRWKVGELAKATGLTVRALHHYDELGLLTPSGRTESGHRLYRQADLSRLQHIVALRQLGFSLEQVAEALRRPELSALQTIAAVRRDLRQRRQAIDELDDKLAGVEQTMANGGEVSTERLIQLIEGMTMYEKYFTKDQLATIKTHGDALGPERLRQATDKDWPALIAAVRAAEANGTDPADPLAQDLARRWQRLIEEFTGGDPGIAAGLRQMYQQDADAFAADKVGGFGQGAVADLASCVRFIERAMQAKPK